MHYDSYTYSYSCYNMKKKISAKGFDHGELQTVLTNQISFCLPGAQVQSLDELEAHFLTAISQHGSIVRANHNHQIYFPPTFWNIIPV